MSTKSIAFVGVLLVLAVSLVPFCCRKDKGRGGKPFIEEKAYIVCDPAEPNAVAPRVVMTLFQGTKLQSISVIFVDKDNIAWCFETSTPHMPARWNVTRTDLNSASDARQNVPIQEGDFKTLRQRWAHWFPNAAER